MEQLSLWSGKERTSSSLEESSSEPPTPPMPPLERSAVTTASSWAETSSTEGDAFVMNDRDADGGQ